MTLVVAVADDTARVSSWHWIHAAHHCATSRQVPLLGGPGPHVLPSPQQRCLCCFLVVLFCWGCGLWPLGFTLGLSGGIFRVEEGAVCPSSYLAL